MAEVIELNVDEVNPEPIRLNDSGGGTKSVNFGPGIELLMNDKKTKEGEPDADIHLGDLNKLEDELNDLADDAGSGVSISKKDSSGILNSISLSTPTMSSAAEPLEKSLGGNNSSSTLPPALASNVGKSTSKTGEAKENKTWDGFASFNDIPMNPDVRVPEKPKLTKEEMLREKFQVLRKLEELERKGAKLSKRYSMESSLAEMQGEYETLVSEREKKNSVQFQGKMLLAAITGLEFLNNKIDPFDLKLDGWSEQVNENIDDYDEIFSELHEKYKSKSKMAPELKLLFQLGGSAIMLHMTNSMFKSSLPNMDDILRQNPDLMKQFSSAASNSMQDSHPGFSGFMNNMMGGGMGGGGGGGGFRAGNDMDMDMDMDLPPRPNRAQPPSPRNDNIKISRSSDEDGINIMESFGQAGGIEKSSRRPRPEMKGPGNINDLLSGLKTKRVDVSSGGRTGDGDDGSTISVTELKEMNADINTRSVPKKSKRRGGSEKNSISLDI